MSPDPIDGAITVSGSQPRIPALIRRELDTGDGDLIRWSVEANDRIRVQVVQQQVGSFADFEGYEGTEEADVTSERDGWGVESS
ncbi:MAG: AbrB/MazE/SpoVT family DNA-binding domain-containing protein [Halodesulfurarchaeum sp.]